MTDNLTDFLAKPLAGWTVAIGNVGASMLSYVAHLNALLTTFSLLIGIGVGILTIMVQRKKLKAEVKVKVQTKEHEKDEV